ncbi:MAG: hypothetical protein AMJ79_15525, partial [Phycisphaerae bacterium SM23_30]
DDSNTHLRSYIYGNYIDEVLVKTEDSDDIFYAHNHLYSPVALIDDEGDVLERYEYDAYGKPYFFEHNLALADTQASDYNNVILFTGRRVDFLDDGDLTLQYSRHRYYDYHTGRWLTQDKIGYDDGMNLYQYVKSNPLRYFDPFGFYYDPYDEIMPDDPAEEWEEPYDLDWEWPKEGERCKTKDKVYVPHAFAITTIGHGPHDLDDFSEDIDRMSNIALIGELVRGGSLLMFVDRTIARALKNLTIKSSGSFSGCHLWVQTKRLICKKVWHVELDLNTSFPYILKIYSHLEWCIYNESDWWEQCDVGSQDVGDEMGPIYQGIYRATENVIPCFKELIPMKKYNT